VRITAQLLSAADEEHLWAERYDRNVRDVVAIQNEIVAAIAREIHVHPGQERVCEAVPDRDSL
jgi:adenylate cyclase